MIGLGICVLATTAQALSTKCESATLGPDGEQFHLTFDAYMGTAWVDWIVPNRVHARMRMKVESVPPCSAFSRAITSESYPVLSVPDFLRSTNLASFAASIGEISGGDCPHFPLLLIQNRDEMALDCFFKYAADAVVRLPTNGGPVCVDRVDPDALTATCQSLALLGEAVLEAANRAAADSRRNSGEQLHDALAAMRPFIADSSEDSDSDWDPDDR